MQHLKWCANTRSSSSPAHVPGFFCSSTYLDQAVQGIPLLSNWSQTGVSDAEFCSKPLAQISRKCLWFAKFLFVGSSLSHSARDSYMQLPSVPTGFETKPREPMSNALAAIPVSLLVFTALAGLSADCWLARSQCGLMVVRSTLAAGVLSAATGVVFVVTTDSERGLLFNGREALGMCISMSILRV